MTRDNDQPAGDTHKIAAAFDEWVRRMCRQDACPREIAALYAPDATLLGTFSPAPCCSPGQIEDYFRRFLRGKSGLRIRADGEPHIQVYGCGEERLALHSGLYTFSFIAEGRRRHVPARYTFAYRWDGAGWRIVLHHSSALPKDDM